MPVPDEIWDKVVETIRLKIIDSGYNSGVTVSPEFLLVVKENWDLIGDETLMDSYIKTKRLEELRAIRDTEQAVLDDVLAEITQLESLLGIIE